MGQKWAELFLAAGASWLEDKGPRLGAALAYYALFSLAPLLLIAIACAGLVFGRDAAEGHLLGQLREIVGAEAGAAIQAIVAHAGQSHRGVVASLVGAAMLFVGAVGLFTELQDALNTIWRVPPRPRPSIATTLKTYFPSFFMVVSSAVLLLVSLAIDVALTAFASWFGALPTHPAAAFLHVVAVFALIGFLSALVYRVLPDTDVAWKDVWAGAALASLFFGFGKYLFGIYLRFSAAGSAYGAAGSVVVLLIWLYYSAQAFLFGAEITKAYAERFGSRRTAQ